MGDLEVATVKQLVDELRKRFSAMVFVAETDPDGENPNGTFQYFTKGGLSARFGMLDRMRLELAAEHASCEDIDAAPDDQEDDE